MRILWLSHTARFGGAELALAEAVTALQALGHQSYTVMPRDGPLRGKLGAASGIEIIHWNGWVNVPSRLDGLRWLAYDYLRAAAAVRRLAIRIAADLIVTNTLTVPVGAFAARKAGIPHVWFVHEFGRDDHNLRFLLGLPLTLRLVGGLSNTVLVNSDALRTYLGHWIALEKTRVVRYAVDVPSIPSAVSRRGSFRLVLCATRIRGKGQHEAIEATAMVVKRGLDVELELIGEADPKYESELRELCARLGIENRVRFLPFQANPFERMAAADCVLVCSRREAFGRVTVEAMKLGKPVIGAASGGTRELIRPGWNGCLYRHGDVGELADTIEQLYRNPERARQIGERARDWARETFTYFSYGEQLAQSLTQAVNGPQSRAREARSV